MKNGKGHDSTASSSSTGAGEMQEKEGKSTDEALPQ